jgi:hypothetical protein
VPRWDGPRCGDAWRHRTKWCGARVGGAGLGGRHGRRGGFAPVSRSGDRRGASAGVTQAEGTAIASPCHGVEAGASLEARLEVEGKADKRAPLVSCLGERKKGAAVRLGGWAGGGRARVGCARVGRARVERKDGAGLGCLCWAGFGLEAQVGLG